MESLRDKRFKEKSDTPPANIVNDINLIVNDYHLGTCPKQAYSTLSTV